MEKIFRQGERLEGVYLLPKLIESIGIASIQRVPLSRELAITGDRAEPDPGDRPTLKLLLHIWLERGDGVRNPIWREAFGEARSHIDGDSWYSLTAILPGTPPL